MLQRLLALSILSIGVNAITMGVSDAAILWHQELDPSVGSALADQEFPDGPGFDIYVVSDVEFASDVRIDEISVPFTSTLGNWPDTAEATLNIFPVDLALDTEDPTSGMQVPVTIGNHPFFTVHSVTATDLNIELRSGSYWIGLTPIIPNDPFDQEFHFRANAQIGSGSFVRNPGGGFDLGTDWIPTTVIAADFVDAAITVRGAEIAIVPEPSAALALLLLQLGFVVRRRRG